MMTPGMLRYVQLMRVWPIAQDLGDFSMTGELDSLWYSFSDEQIAEIEHELDKAYIPTASADLGLLDCKASDDSIPRRSEQ